MIRGILRDFGKVALVYVVLAVVMLILGVLFGTSDPGPRPYWDEQDAAAERMDIEARAYQDSVAQTKEP